MVAKEPNGEPSKKVREELSNLSPEAQEALRDDINTAYEEGVQDGKTGLGRARRKAAALATAVTATVTLAGPPAVRGIESLEKSSSIGSAIDKNITTPIATIAQDHPAGSHRDAYSVVSTAVTNGIPSDATGAMRATIKVAQAAEQIEGADAGPLTVWAAKQPLTGSPSKFLNDAKPYEQLSKQEAGQTPG